MATSSRAPRGVEGRRWGVALGFAIAAASCHPGGDQQPRTTSDLKGQWDALLTCSDAATCLAVSAQQRYMLDSDRDRMAGRLASFGGPAVPALATAAGDPSRPRQRDLAERALAVMGEPALAWARDHDDPQGFAVLVRLALDSPHVVATRPLLLERLPRQREWLLGMLRANPEAIERNPGLALLRLLGSDAAPLGESLCPLLDAQGHREWDLAVNLAQAMGRTGARACIPALARALELPSFRVTSASLEALARLGDDEAGSARRAVLRVATRHWSRQVRWRAVTAMRLLREPVPFDELATIEAAVARGETYREYLASGSAGPDPVAAAFGTLASDEIEGTQGPTCTRGRRVGAHVTVRDGTDTATLPPLASGAEARVKAHQADLPAVTLAGLGLGLDLSLRDAARDAVRTESLLVIAACAGELGGGLVAVTDGAPQRLHAGCFARLMTVGPRRDTLWVFEGSSDFGSRYGRIWRVQRDGKKAELWPVVDLPANAIAAGRGPTAVRVATLVGDLAVELDGTVRALGCAPP